MGEGRTSTGKGTRTSTGAATRPCGAVCEGRRAPWFVHGALRPRPPVVARSVSRCARRPRDCAASQVRSGRSVTDAKPARALPNGCRRPFEPNCQLGQRRPGVQLRVADRLILESRPRSHRRAPPRHGSHSRARGATHQDGETRPMTVRSIPARAGPPLESCLAQPRGPVHPRARGATLTDPA